MTVADDDARHMMRLLGEGGRGGDQAIVAGESAVAGLVAALAARRAPDDADELARAKSVNDNMIARTLAMGGTCTGEHGVGIGKMEYMEAEHGDSLDVMRLIKRSMDPQNLMNPGKVLKL